MSRGFDGPEIDDFHGPERDVSRGPESNSRAGWDSVRRLERIRGEEERADQRQEVRGAAGGNRPPLPREDRVQLVLARTSRTNYVDRNRTHQLRDSELHALTEIGKFRVLAVHDLAQFAYNSDSSRMQNDLANLSRQGLVKQTSILDSDLSPVRAVTLTKEGHQAPSYNRSLRPDQVTYHGLKKAKEAFHDAELYRLCHKVSNEIEVRGGKVVRVKLDYEIKRESSTRKSRSPICASNTRTTPTWRFTRETWNSPQSTTVPANWRPKRAPASRSTPGVARPTACGAFAMNAN